MHTRRIIWTLLLILNLIFFFFIIPVDIYSKSNLLLSSVGATLFFMILFQVMADLETLYDLFEKQDPEEPMTAGRKMAPFSIIPAGLLLFALVFYHTERKNEELNANGILTQGKVINGGSNTSMRRLQASTSYSIKVEYVDSLDYKHTVEETIDGSEFDNFYEGAEVDVVYSSVYPGLASVILKKEELVKFKDASIENLTISDLIKILDGKVKNDSIKSYLNSINSDWITTSENGYYENTILNMVIKLSKKKDHMVYVKKSNMLVSQNTKFSFEANIIENGFKKKISYVDGEAKEQYFNGKFIIKKEWQQLGNNSAGDGGYDIYYIAKVDSVKE